MDTEPVTAEQPNSTQQFSDLVRATQFGRYEECRQYLESNLFDVNQRDNENVTLLHWAAINNKSNIVDYYLSKGADINAIGGDLKSTPLQWAVRQGHLSMVVLLLKRGADWNTLDVESCNALHLAAQFGHTAIVAYLVAKGMSVDQPDGNGMTALMWSAYRISKVDPTRLLMTLGASHKLTDYQHKNTALHWAVYAKNLTAITLLLEAGSDVDVHNANDESPLTLARKNQSPWLVKMLEAHTREQPQRSNLLQRIANNKQLGDIVRNLTPFIAYFMLAFIIDSGLTPLVKILCIFMMSVLLFIFSRFIHDSCLTTNFPVAVYLALTFWLYYTMFYFFTSCKYHQLNSING